METPLPILYTLFAIAVLSALVCLFVYIKGWKSVGRVLEGIGSVLVAVVSVLFKIIGIMLVVIMAIAVGMNARWPGEDGE